jgi:hypothetical protein
LFQQFTLWFGYSSCQNKYRVKFYQVTMRHYPINFYLCSYNLRSWMVCPDSVNLEYYLLGKSSTTWSTLADTLCGFFLLK